MWFDIRFLATRVVLGNIYLTPTTSRTRVNSVSSTSVTLSSQIVCLWECLNIPFFLKVMEIICLENLRAFEEYYSDGANPSCCFRTSHFSQSSCFEFFFVLFFGGFFELFFSIATFWYSSIPWELFNCFTSFF